MITSDTLIYIKSTKDNKEDNRVDQLNKEMAQNSANLAQLILEDVLLAFFKDWYMIWYIIISMRFFRYKLY